MKCKNHATCKGQAQDGKKVCWECEKADRDAALYAGFVYIDQHAEDRKKYEHKQKGKK